ncbi:MAG: sugar ABC transporter ATP-binding protein [Clostridium sp.]|nr:sugar ABC transporter ATP-binding protein [Clostridium sp.]
MDEKLLEMKHISKSFSGVKVLNNVDFSLDSGEVCALMGENGAGKSTLMKILGGIYSKDSGEIYIRGEKVRIGTVEDAKSLGIRMIHQEISLNDYLTVAENIFMGRYITGRLGLVDFREMNRQTQSILDRMNLNIKAGDIVGKLSIAQQQMIEICRSIYDNAKILIMDEPTASLTDKEIDELFLHINELKASGVGIIYISHRMEEISRIADRVTVLRDGLLIGSLPGELVSHVKIINMMVGRELKEVYQYDRKEPGSTILEVKHLKNDKLKDISFSLGRGEILGFSGLMGAGRTEIARAIFGIDKLDSGEIYIDGRRVQIKTPEDAIGQGIALVPEDRKAHGLILDNTIRFNMVITVLDKFIKFIFYRKSEEKNIIDQYLNRLSIKMAGTEQNVRELSGGNQQKVVISKWLATSPRILILDEPTRGIDVGAKSEIYKLISEIAGSGVAVIFISSEMPEILGMCKRVAVVHEGRLSAVLDSGREPVTQEKIMYFAAGGKG